MSPPPTLSVYASVGDVRNVIAADIAHTRIPVLNDAGRPIGVVGRGDLIEILAGAQNSGSETSSVETIRLDRHAARCPIADINNNLEMILEMYGVSDNSGAIVVTEASAFAGMFDADSLVHLLKEGFLRSARDRNELTKLPGSNSVMQYVAKAMERVEVNTIFGRLELRNFKPFNDVYGFRQGDRAIVLLAEILQSESPDPASFIGHMGGKRFFVAIEDENPEVSEALIRKFVDEFGVSIETLYVPEDRSRRAIVARDSVGNFQQYPLMDCSAAMIHLRSNETRPEIGELMSRLEALNELANSSERRVTAETL